ncbi:hypothetical protein [Bacillus phage SPbetaL6]|nr:hypothetical protein [Bacillus phage SPbetaL6]WIT27966.1 hypothetical protein [Bacillus phage SPbetaL7]
MDQTQIAILTLIFTIVGVIVTLLIAMFPRLFPKIGALLLSLNFYVWVIILLLFIIVGQQILIYVN